MSEGIRLGTNGRYLFIVRLGYGDVLSPPFETLWDVRGWLIGRGYTASDAARFLTKSTGPVPPCLFEGPEAA